MGSNNSLKDKNAATESDWLRKLTATNRATVNRLNDTMCTQPSSELITRRATADANAVAVAFVVEEAAIDSFRNAKRKRERR